MTDQKIGRQAVVLVVDDDEAVRKLLRMMLESGGYKVAEAANGRQALSQLQRLDVDVVLTDLAMPEQEGFETIQAIRRDKPGLKVIAMSGAFGADFLHMAELLGAHGTLQKPLRAQDVLRAVSDALAS